MGLRLEQERVLHLLLFSFPSDYVYRDGLFAVAYQ